MTFLRISSTSRTEVFSFIQHTYAHVHAHNNSEILLGSCIHRPDALMQGLKLELFIAWEIWFMLPVRLLSTYIIIPRYVFLIRPLEKRVTTLVRIIYALSFSGPSLISQYRSLSPDHSTSSPSLLSQVPWRCLNALPSCTAADDFLSDTVGNLY